jgi:hypothetical protein
MARLPALVDALDLNDPRGKPTIAHIARLVRSAGLIESTKRGAGGTDMTFADATTLLLAACGDPSPQNAVDSVKNLRSLRPSPSEPPARQGRVELPTELRFLEEGQSFAKTIELMISNAPQIAHRAVQFQRANPRIVSELRERQRRNPEQVGGSDYQYQALTLSPAGRVVRVVFYSPGLFSEIHCGRLAPEFGDDDGLHEYYAPAAAWNVGRSDPGAKRRAIRQSDTVISMEVGLPTLLALHDAVQAPSRSGRPRKRHVI